VPATDLAVDLARLLAPERVLTGASVAPYDVDGVRPAFALLPDSVSEVSAVLHFADQRRLAVVPWGGGTEIAYGNKPERFDLALDLRRLAAVIEFSPEDLVVTAQAGLTVGALNKILGGRGQFLALDVPQPDLATIGGALSVGVTGPSRPRYGTARDLVIGLTCVLAGGQVVHSGGRVVKNVAGYDLNKLYLHALGTLGVIVEASFKLHPLPPAASVLTATFVSCNEAHAASLAIINSNLSPAAVELCSPVASQALGQGDGGPAWLLAVRMSGLPAAVERQEQGITALARAAGAGKVVQEHPDAGADVFRRLRDFGRGPDSAPALLLRCAVRPSEIADAVSRIGPLFGDGPEPAIVASPASGTIQVAWSEPPAALEELVQAMRDALAQVSGTVTVERCPAEHKAGLEIWGVSGSDLVMWHDLKAAFDPNGTLSPGRYVDRL